MLSIILSFTSVQTGLAKWATHRVNASYGTDIYVEKLDLSSIRNVSLKNVLIKDHHGDTLIAVDILETSVLNYRQIFGNQLSFGDIYLENGKFFLRTYKEESLNNLSVFVNKFRREDGKKGKTFKMSSSSISVDRINFTLFNENKKEDAIVFYRRIHGSFDDFSVVGSNVSARIRDLRVVENHDVVVTNFNTDFSYSNTRMEFLNTNLSTRGSELLADIVFTYEKEDLSDFTNKVHIEADFKKGDVVLSDLKKLYGQFGKNDEIHFSAKAKGTINDFEITDIDLESDRHSTLRGDFHLKNVLYPNSFELKGAIKEISSNYDHLINLLPNLLGTKIPKELEKLGYFSSSGKVAITKSSVDLQLKTIAQMGLSDIDLKLLDIDKGDKVSYKGKIELIDFKLGTFVRDSLIGDFSMVGEVEGQGFSIDAISIGVKGHISKHQYKGYTYSNIDINGVLRDKQFDGFLRVDDPNIKLEFRGLAELSEIKKFNFEANIAHVDFLKLNLFTRDEKSVLKGIINMDLQGSSLDNIEGMLSFKDASYSNQNDDYYFKDFTITSENKKGLREVKVNSTDIVNGYVRGNFKFRQLKKLGMNSLGSLFVNYEKEPVTEGQFLDFRFNIYNKIVDVFFPDLILGPNSIIKGKVNSDEDVFKLTIKSPEIEAFDYAIDNINLQVDNKNPLYSTLLSIDEIDSKYYNLSEINLVNVILNDTLFMRADMTGGKDKQERYYLSFYHTINENNQSVLGMKKSDLVFKKNTWHINPENNTQNKIVYDDDIKTYAIDNFNMTTENQEVHLAGLISGGEKNLDLRLKNVNLEDITPSIDSVAVDGKVNGSINLRTINNKTLPIADMTINYFSINDDYYGDLNFKAASDQNIRNYTFDMVLENSGLKTFKSSGAIDLTTDEPTILATAALDKFRINAFSPLGKNVLSKIRGFASGEASITGILRNPDISGKITLVDSGLELPYLNVNYDFEGESVVKLYDHTFDFQSFKVVDRAKKTRGVIDGTISHRGFKKWKLDLLLKTNNLLVLNTEDKEGALYYGTGLLGGTTTLKGFTDDLAINVNGTTNAGTEFIVPLGNVSTINSSKLIHFENVELEEGEKRNDDIIFDKFKGLTLNFKLNVTRQAVAQIVLDKATGSILRGSGVGNLALNIDTNGKFEMFGNLTIDNGEYQFKNIINKDFEVQKGGTIVWEGNPYDAQVDITAINYTKANPSVLLDEIASSRKIDVELYTMISGNLSAPNLDFDVKIPNASSVVASELDFKLRNEDDKLTQFFSLLATGAFARTENNRTNFDGNAAIAGTLAQKASQLLSNMLESENENFEVGVTYDIGTENSVQDVITDDQLGLEVSGRIADKVIVSGKVGVPVGSNTNSNVIGEVEVKVPLNQAETLQAKVYNRQNEIQFDVVEGEGYTQGVGISYRFDFNNGGEFLEKIGLKKTAEEKEMTKGQLDSVRAEKKVIKMEFKEEKSAKEKME